MDERADIADNFPRLIEGCAKREVERGVGGLVEVDGRAGGVVEGGRRRCGKVDGGEWLSFSGVRACARCSWW